jgi:hypothetical protein
MAVNKELKSDFLFELEGTIIGPYVANEGRVIYPLTEGWFKGPKLQGKIIHGGDWLIMNANGGVHSPDVRLILQSEDQEIIYMYYKGVLTLPQTEGELPYLRTNPMFQASGKYSWLNSILAVGVGTYVNIPGGKVRYDVFQIL